MKLWLLWWEYFVQYEGTETEIELIWARTEEEAKGLSELGDGRFYLVRLVKLPLEAPQTDGVLYTPYGAGRYEYGRETEEQEHRRLDWQRKERERKGRG